jgi:hypothetical protein
MATSGSVDFTLTAGELVEKAFGKIGVKVAEQALEASEMQDGIDTINLMFKTWQAQGLHLWSKTEGVLFLDAGKTDYLLGPTGDKATTLDDFVGTTTTTALVASDVIVPVTSTSGMTTGDIAGIELDDGTRQWTTLTVDSATQITLAAGVTSAAASGNTLFTYTTIIDRPLRVIGARRSTFSSSTDIQLFQFSRFDYFNQTNKQSQGTVVNYYHSPQLGNSRFYVWQTSSSVNDLVKFTFERAIEDVDDKDNNVDFPAEWLETIVYNLAARLADDYDAPIAKVQSVTTKAAQSLDLLTGWDEEPDSINIQPSFN